MAGGTLRIGEAVMAGPAGKENGGCCHCSSHGLLAYGASSSVVIVDVRSMQLVSTLPMPAVRGAPLLPAPYVTAVQWIPEGFSRDLTQESATNHLRLAAGDRQGRVAVLDIGLGEVTSLMALEGEKSRLGIQDLCWVYGSPWLLVAIHGPSQIALWDPHNRNLLWRFDASPEILGSIRRDPFDARQVCAVSLKGLLITLHVGGAAESDVLMKQYRVGTQEDRNINGSSMGGSDLTPNSGSASVGAPALASSPGVFARSLFSIKTRGLLFVMLSREIIVFDLQFGTALSSVNLPRGCGKLLELVAIDNGNILFCAHVDGKLSAWKRKDGSQVFSLCHMEPLMPQMGTAVPAPSVLAVVLCPLNFYLDTADRVGMEETNSLSGVKARDFTVSGSVQRLQVHKPDLPPLAVHSGIKTRRPSKTTFVSISDDGRLWHWALKMESSKATIHMTGNVDRPKPISGDVVSAKRALEVLDGGLLEKQTTELEKLDSSSMVVVSSQFPSDFIFQLELTGQLQMLSSIVTTLAVPNPSLQAITPGGGNGGAAPVPLIALATQGGIIELMDPAANAVTSNFSLHNNNVVRGVRWLGNSRLVSFSYTEVKGKGGGFINRLVLTCVRSGQSKLIRMLQKPERAPMRALRTSPSGRYMLILFREAPAEVWAMTRTPQMLRSLALPFTVMEWALPPAPRTSASSQSIASRRSSLAYRERPTIASTVAAANAPQVSSAPVDSTVQEESTESFAFALVNGSLGVFELRGKRVRDFKPKWPVASFVSPDILVTAMAYRIPHVVMGDRLGNLRWWDVTTGFSSWFNTHKGGIRRIKFAPVCGGDEIRGRIAVLFNDNTFVIYDLDAQDPIANALVQPQLAGILVLELDWFPVRSDKQDPLLLCVIGADNSFRLLDVHPSMLGGKPARHGPGRLPAWERLRPMPVYSAALLPIPHALALRMLLQEGVEPSWFEIFVQLDHDTNSGTPLGTRGGDLRSYLLEASAPRLGDAAVAEVLLKSLELQKEQGRLLDIDSISDYSAVCNQGCATRYAFAAAHFGDYLEATFWLQLPKALDLLNIAAAKTNASWEESSSIPFREKLVPEDEKTCLSSAREAEPAEKKSADFSTIIPTEKGQRPPSVEVVSCMFESHIGVLKMSQTSNQIFVLLLVKGWHGMRNLVVMMQCRKKFTIGDYEAAVTLLLSTPPNSPHFYVDSLRAVALAAAVSPALHELAVKVVAANLVGTEDPLSGTHLLCAVGRYQEACSQLQDAGRWLDACTLAAAHLQGSDYRRILERWAEHVLHKEHNLWRAMILFVSAGALSEALAALRNAQLPDAAAMFLIACHEAKTAAILNKPFKGNEDTGVPFQAAQTGVDMLDLPDDLNHQVEVVQSVCEYYGQYQRLLAHLCTGITSW
ncbi:hypothetical protein O6H91_05G117000 [Diphasiastrum complanatum]|uniref:Uncharacterized protein n=1 Tax=Diphasiastrum complanatum TaxID=34168 RepID=A0ACC2DSU9_DIPCM|nr:hypothetical protein O6H91_05G117000 [Diphasiastrum complanatum]